MMTSSMYYRLLGFFILLTIVLIRADIAKLLKDQGYPMVYIVPPISEGEHK